MSETWIKALLLACLFGAVLISVEVLVNWLASTRSEGKAINLRLNLIGAGRTHGETLNLLRRRESVLPPNLPPVLDHIGRKFERMLTAAQVTIPTGRLMLIILLAPVILFFGMLLVMTLADVPISAGRLLLIGTFCGMLG